MSEHVFVVSEWLPKSGKELELWKRFKELMALSKNRVLPITWCRSKLFDQTHTSHPISRACRHWLAIASSTSIKSN